MTDGTGVLTATGTGVSGSGTTSLTISGSLSQVNADLTTLSDTDSSAGSDTITLTASDSFGNVATAQIIGVTVTPGQNDNWINASGGTWTNAAAAGADWSLAAPPLATQNVMVSASGTNAYTVTIPNAATANAATVTLNSARATLLDQGALLLNGALNIDAGTFELSGSGTFSGATSITNAGTFEIAENFTLASSITNNNGIVQVGAGDTLTISGVTINSGTVNDGIISSAATISVSGNSAIENTSFNYGVVSIAAGVMLTLDGTTLTGSTITSLNTANTTGVVNVDGSQTLTLAGTDTVTGGVLAIALGYAQAAADNSVLFSPVGIGDLNSGANPSLTLTIQASSGSFAPISGSGLTLTQSGDEVTITGDLTDINKALDNGITYTPATGVTSNTLMLSVTDGLGDAAFKTISVNTSTAASPTTTNLSASGEITNAGLIDVTGTATLSSDAVLNTGTVKIESGEHLTLNDSKIYGGTVTDNSTVEDCRHRVRSPAVLS